MNNAQVKDIIRWGQIGIISCRIAQVLGINPLDALKAFYRSETCRKFHDMSTGLYLYSERYIADEFFRETGNEAAT